MVRIVPNEKFKSVYKKVRTINNMPTRRRALTTLCVDASSKKPISGAMVVLGKQKKGVLSGKKGKNYFQHQKPANYVLQVSHPSYETQTLSVIISSKKHTTLTIEL